MEMKCIPETFVTGWTTDFQNRFDSSRGIDVSIPVKKAALYFASFRFISARIYIMGALWSIMES